MKWALESAQEWDWEQASVQVSKSETVLGQLVEEWVLMSEKELALGLAPGLALALVMALAQVLVWVKESLTMLLMVPEWELASVPGLG